MAINIAGTITVAVAIRFMYLFFLSGKTIRSTTLAGRFVDTFKSAARRFARGWTGQGWRYRLIALPCMLVSMAGVSSLMYWLMPVMQTGADGWAVFKYCVLIFLVGISASLSVAFLLIFGVYFIAELIGRRWAVRRGVDGGGEP